MTSLRFLPEQIEQWPLARLKPYAKNARTHSDDQIAKIAASLVEYGWTAPVMVADDGEIVAGHGRLLAAQHLGLSEVPIIRLAHLTPEQVRAYRIADNRLSELSGWDDELLAAELHALNAAGFDLDLTGFEGEDLDRLLAPLDEGDGLAGEDVIPEPPVNPVSRPGDLWLLGDHRLLCGDSTKADDVIRVMHNHRAILFATDPPYLVDYDGTNHPSKQGGPDKNKDWSRQLRHHLGRREPGPGAVRGLHPAGDRARHPAQRRLVLLARQPPAGDGRGRVGEVRRLRPPADRLGQGPRHPDALVLPLAARALLLRLAEGQQAAAGLGRLPEHGVAAADGEGGREDRAPDVEAGRGVRHPDAPAHPAGRGLLRAVLAAPARRSSPARRPGGGSIAIEISPQYVDVAVKRWQTATGKQATLDGDGRTFDEIAAERLPKAA